MNELPNHIQVRTPPLPYSSPVRFAFTQLPMIPSSRNTHPEIGHARASQNYALGLPRFAQRTQQSRFANSEVSPYSTGHRLAHTHFTTALVSRNPIYPRYLISGSNSDFIPTNTTIQTISWIQTLPQHFRVVSGGTISNAVDALLISAKETVGSSMTMYPTPVSRELSTQPPITQFLYSVLFRLANNLVPLAAFTEPSGAEEAQWATAVKIFLSLGHLFVLNTLRSAPSVYAQALKKALFHAAVELDAAPIVEALIREGIDPTKESCRINPSERGPFGYDRQLPLERATLLGHTATVKVLLAMGANPNEFKGRKSLAYLLQPLAMDRKAAETLSANEVDIINLLLEHKAGLGQDEQQLMYPAYNGRVLDVRVIECIIRNIGSLDATFFFDAGVLAMILQSYELDKASAALKLVMEQPWFPDASTGCNFEPVMYACLCNAVSRHNDEAMEMLLPFDVRTSSLCLFTAVRCGNIPAVKRLMGTNGNVINRYHHYPTRNTPELFSVPPPQHYENGDTPIAEAIRRNCVEALTLFSQTGELGALSSPSDLGYDCAFRAAIELGDACLVDYFSKEHERSSQSMIGMISETSWKRKWDIVELLLNRGYLPNITTMLHALSSRNKEMCRKILLYSPCHTCSDMISIWKEAIIWGDLEVVIALKSAIGLLEHALLDIGDYDAQMSNCWGLDFSQGNILCSAILHEKTEVVNYLLTIGVMDTWLTHSKLCPNKSQPMTPLAATVRIRNFNLFTRLIELGADPFDNAAIFVATEQKLLDYVQTLLHAFTKRYPVRIRPYGWQALGKAVEMGHSKLIRTLMLCVDPNGFGIIVEDESMDTIRWGVSALGVAISSLRGRTSFRELLCTLIKAGADINGPVTGEGDGSPIPAVLWAIKHENLEALKELLDQGAKIDVPASLSQKKTPLQLASELEQVETVKYLLAKGADPNARVKPRNGLTPLQLAACAGNVMIARILVDAGALIDEQSGYVYETEFIAGRTLSMYLGMPLDDVTAFEVAASKGRLSMMEYLFEKGANLLSDGGKQYRKAVDVAKKYGQTAAFHLVEEMYQQQKATVIYCPSSPEDNTLEADPAAFWTTYLSRKQASNAFSGTEPCVANEEGVHSHPFGHEETMQPVDEGHSGPTEELLPNSNIVPWGTAALEVDGPFTLEEFSGEHANIAEQASFDHSNDMPSLFGNPSDDFPALTDEHIFCAPPEELGLDIEQMEGAQADNWHDYFGF